MKEEYGRSLQHPACGLRPGAAHRLRQRRQPAAGPLRGPPRTNRSAPGDRRHRGGRSSCRPWRKASCWPWPAASWGWWSPAAAARLLLVAGVPQLAVPAHQHRAVAHGAGVRLRRWRCVTGVVFGAAPAWFATRTDPIEALRGSGRGSGDRSSFARKALLVVQATLSVVLVAGATMLARSLNKLEHQDFGFRVEGRVVVSLNKPPATYTAAAVGSALPAAGGRLESPARRTRIGAGALQPADRQLGRADLRVGPSRAQAERGVRARPGTA